MSDLERSIRRNTLLLASVNAVNSIVLQLAAAVSTLTFVLVTGHAGLLGLGPAIFLVSSGITAVVAGRSMDRHGRRPVLAVGFIATSAGCLTNALATRYTSTPVLLVGFVLIGAGMATSLLIRTAAGDMYTPAHRATGISRVLFGSVFGAVLGPAVFSPLFAGHKVAPHVLTIPWLAASAIALFALALVLAVRPDPRDIGRRLSMDVDGAGVQTAPATAAPLGEIIRRPGVLPAMAASLASFAVMVSVMNLTGYVVVAMHHHPQTSVFPIVGAHVLGMFALVLVIGAVIDRIGRGPALAGGLVVMAFSVFGLEWWSSVPATAVLLFGLGIGWNFSFVAATAQLSDLTSALERGKLLGFTDLVANLLAAAMALIGGYGLETSGVGALAVGAGLVALSPVAWILWRHEPAPATSG